MNMEDSCSSGEFLSVEKYSGNRIIVYFFIKLASCFYSAELLAKKTKTLLVCISEHCYVIGPCV